MDELHGLGPNQRAVLERIPWRAGRRMAAALVRLKMRLQFTGWLQYLLPLPVALLLLLLAAVPWWLGSPGLAMGLGGLATVLFAIVVFDIVTCRWQVRLPESRPAPVAALGPFDLLRARRSCRSFQTRRMSDTDRAAVMSSVDRSLARAPIGHITPRLVYISAPLTVWPTVNGSEFLVAIVPKPYVRQAVIEVGRCLQRVVMEVTGLGLATCWIGPGADQNSIVRHLGERFDPEREHVICVCAVGYRSAYIPLMIRLFNRKMSSSRLPLSALFFTDERMESPVDVSAPPFSRLGRTFEACQWAPSSYNGQTTRGVVDLSDAGSLSRVRFRTTTKSRFYAPVALGIWLANWEIGCEALGLEGHFEPGPGPPGEGHDVAWVPTRAISP